MSTAPQIAPDWWQSFFDDDYALIWSDVIAEDATKSQADALWTLLQLHEGSRLLDAACGYGRVSRPLAERGAAVVGADQSAALLKLGEQNRGALPESQLRYVHHDLRYRFDETGFDAAINLFSSIGFGTEADDLAILTTIHEALRPGGLFFLDVIQRDAVVAFFVGGRTMARRRADGILVVEEGSWDPIAGRIRGTWYWAGAGVSGSKTAEMRVYAINELLRLTESAGFELRGTYLSVSTQPFKEEPPHMGGRIGLLLQRPK